MRSEGSVNQMNLSEERGSKHYGSGSAGLPYMKWCRETVVIPLFDKMETLMDTSCAATMH